MNNPILKDMATLLSTQPPKVEMNPAEQLKHDLAGAATYFNAPNWYNYQHVLASLAIYGSAPARRLLSADDREELLRISNEMVQNLGNLLQPPPKPFARICMHVQKGRQI